jgi:hypothetical protein
MLCCQFRAIVTRKEPVNFLEKLINDPEEKTLLGSPLARAVFGAGCLVFDLNILVSGAIRTSKAGNGTYIHFSDHPVEFSLTFIGGTLFALWLLRSSRERYLMHDD